MHAGVFLSEMQCMFVLQLFNIMTCKEEARRLKGSGVEVYVAHPGLSVTDHFGKVCHYQPKLVGFGICTFERAARLRLRPYLTWR